MKKINLNFNKVKNWSKKHIFLFTILIIFSVNMFLGKMISMSMLFTIQCSVVIIIAIILYLDIEYSKDKKKKKENEIKE